MHPSRLRPKSGRGATPGFKTSSFWYVTLYGKVLKHLKPGFYSDNNDICRILYFLMLP